MNKCWKFIVVDFPSYNLLDLKHVCHKVSSVANKRTAIVKERYLIYRLKMRLHESCEKCKKASLSEYFLTSRFLNPAITAITNARMSWVKFNGHFSTTIILSAKEQLATERMKMEIVQIQSVIKHGQFCIFFGGETEFAANVEFILWNIVFFYISPWASLRDFENTSWTIEWYYLNLELSARKTSSLTLHEQSNCTFE